MIIKWFGDQPTPHSPFSIHSLVSLGTLTGKRAGDWYGPASVAHLLSQAVKVAATAHNEFENLAVYVAQDCSGKQSFTKYRVIDNRDKELCPVAYGNWAPREQQ